MIKKISSDFFGFLFGRRRTRRRRQRKGRSDRACSDKIEHELIDFVFLSPSHIDGSNNDRQYVVCLEYKMKLGPLRSRRMNLFLCFVCCVIGVECATSFCALLSS